MHRFGRRSSPPPTGGTLFVGLYEVTLEGPVPPGQIDPLTLLEVGAGRSDGPADQYDCKPVRELSAYVGRLFVHWGESSSASRAWVQRAELRDKEIVELTRTFQEESFPGFMQFIRPLSEIEAMPISWKEVLTASRGIYLLACPKTREHYVGSACGEGGFLGRWRDYVTNNHGGNIGLQGRDPSDLQVSILEVASSSSSVEEILALEAAWKAKLLSRTIGLNRN